MRRSTFVFLIVAGSLILAGIATFIVAMSINGWNFKNLSTVEFKTSTYEITEDFDEIVTTSGTADVVFLPSKDSKCTAICYEQENIIYEVKVDGNKLVIDEKDNRKWYEYIEVAFDTPRITVYLPTDMLTSFNINGSTGDIELSEGLTFEEISISVSTGTVKCRSSANGKIKISVSTGSIDVSDIKADTLDFRASTGSIRLEEVTCSGNIYANMGTGKLIIKDTQCNGVYSAGDTGDVKLTDTIAADAFGIQRSTGDVELERCDAGSITIETSTGDIEGTLLSDKTFFAQTKTGDIDVPKGTTGGTCTLTTTTGDIEIDVR